MLKEAQFSVLNLQQSRAIQNKAEASDKEGADTLFSPINRDERSLFATQTIKFSCINQP